MLCMSNINVWMDLISSFCLFVIVSSFDVSGVPSVIKNYVNWSLNSPALARFSKLFSYCFKIDHFEILYLRGLPFKYFVEKYWAIIRFPFKFLLYTISLTCKFVGQNIHENNENSDKTKVNDFIVFLLKFLLKCTF